VDEARHACPTRLVRLAEVYFYCNCFQEISLSKSYSIGTEFVHKNLSYSGIICSPLKTIDQDGKAVKGFYLAMAGSSISRGKDFLFSPADLDYDLEKAEGQIGLQRDQHSCLI
jgi:hypothetical protein